MTTTRSRAAIRRPIVFALLAAAVSAGLVSSLFAETANATAGVPTTIPAATSSVAGTTSTGPGAAPTTTLAATTTAGVSSTVAGSTSSAVGGATTIPGSTTLGTAASTVVASTVAAAPTTTVFEPGPVLRQGSKGPAVEAMERKLDLLHFEVGEVDGKFSNQTWQGLMAFQKLQGLKRTGKFDEATQRELAEAVIPGGLIPNGGLPRIEIDISRQVMLYFDDYGLNRVIAISTGSEKKYCATSKTNGKPNCGDARTPRGNFRIQRRIQGVHESDLGTLYSPMYFDGGFAIHGSPSIPAYAASHGCVRITNHTADWMFDEVKNGTPVFLFD
jgi:lipoprotein-anchoring transpeptidase ErfK/SrfK